MITVREIQFEAVKDGEPFYGAVRLIGDGTTIVLDREASLALWLGMLEASEQGADFPRPPRLGHIELSFEQLAELEGKK